MIKTILDRELVGGMCDTPVYPITSTRAVYTGNEDGTIICTEEEMLENRLRAIELVINNIQNCCCCCGSVVVADYEIITDEEIIDACNNYLYK